jgi:hypothetical protein
MLGPSVGWMLFQRFLELSDRLIILTRARKPYLGGALAAALLRIAINRKSVVQDLYSRALMITNIGRREMLNRFGLQV